MKVKYIENSDEWNQTYHNLQWPTEFHKPPCVGESIMDDNLGVYQLIVEIVHTTEALCITLDDSMEHFKLSRR